MPSNRKIDTVEDLCRLLRWILTNWARTGRTCALVLVLMVPPSIVIVFFLTHATKLAGSAGLCAALSYLVRRNRAR